MIARIGRTPSTQDQVTGPGDPHGEATPDPRSRRAVLLGALGAVVGAGLGVLGRQDPTQAAAGDPVVIGRVNSAGPTGTTIFADAASPTLSAFNFGAGDGLYAVAVDEDQDGLSATSRATRTGIGSAIRAEGGLNPGVLASTSGFDRAAVSGSHSGSGGVGVEGQSTSPTGEGAGVRGTSSAGTGSGVHGVASSSGGHTQGVLGESSSSAGVGVLGRSTASRAREERAIGVRGESASFAGVWGESAARDGVGVVGAARATGDADASGVIGDSSARSGSGVEGWARATTGPSYGVYGASGSSGGVGVRGTGSAANGSTYGVYADVDSPNGIALFALGNARVTRDATVHGLGTFAAGRYRIDHPSNQARTRTLSQGFVGSDQWKNIYDGSAICNGAGEVVVTLPSWFGRLNRDPRIQLTPIGGPATLYVAEPISGNRFRIGGGAPGQEVYWQVTGVRRDRWAEAHPLRVEENKRGKEADRLLHPEERDADPSRGVTEAYRLARRRRRVR